MTAKKVEDTILSQNGHRILQWYVAALLTIMAIGGGIIGYLMKYEFEDMKASIKESQQDRIVDKTEHATFNEWKSGVIKWQGTTDNRLGKLETRK